MEIMIGALPPFLLLSTVGVLPIHRHRLSPFAALVESRNHPPPPPFCLSLGAAQEPLSLHPLPSCWGTKENLPLSGRKGRRRKKGSEARRTLLGILKRGRIWQWEWGGGLWRRGGDDGKEEEEGSTKSLSSSPTALHLCQPPPHPSTLFLAARVHWNRSCTFLLRPTTVEPRKMIRDWIKIPSEIISI